MDLADGRYKLEKVIGQGGFATVWRGFDSALGVHRAVKLLHPDLSSRTQFRERLRAEARTMARLAHPNVLTVHDIGEQDGQDWFVMDLVEGGSLGDWQQRGGPLPPGLAVACAIQVLSALSAAHAAGVVHRDVKPQNILLDADGRCRLADFGIALLESEEMLRNTKTGATMGSLSYMAPEQRLSAKSVGPSADLYAVGSTLYALLTNANAIDLFTAVPSSARWESVPEVLRPILQQVTQHDPSARYQTAGEMAAALASVERALPEESWEGWLAQVGASRNLAGPTLVLPTMDVMQRSTKAALTILEELEPVGSPPTAVPPLSGAAETYFELPLESDEVLASAIAEIPPGATQLPEDPEPHERRSRALWLGPLAALLLGGVGLWAWAPWQAAAPVLEPVPATAPETLEPEAPDPDPAAEEVSEPSEDQPVIPTATDDAVVEAQPEPEAALLAAPTVQPELESTPADPATSASAVAGRWAGSYNGQDVTLQLSGGDQALRGTLTVEFFGNEQSSTVRGSFAEGRLVLEDQDRNDDYASKHVGTLGADGRIEGQSTTFKGGRVTSFTFWR